MERTLRVGVVGVGHLGQHHARVYAELDECELIGVCDADANRGKEVAARHGTRFFPIYTEFFGHVDALSIAVPTAHHYTLGCACVEQGLPLLIEKPMTRTLEEADHLQALATARNVILQIGHIELFNTAVVQ